ncbi:uncharacterized protein LOC143149940 isoform X3 [Ptiloglossa arizonensis]|uniref:uncharacterized protein LOC143149940 isoform X3 n=1 Tax=Ptiloglossa arizonensis TaxID=3350558 RepID=UPI003FA006E3
MALRGYYSGEKNETDGEETKQRALKRRWFGGRSRETIFVWEKVWNHRAWGGINIPRLRIVLDVDGESRVRGKRRRRASGAEGTRGPWIRSFRVRAQCEPRSARVFVQLAKGGGLHFRARTLAIATRENERGTVDLQIDLLRRSRQCRANPLHICVRGHRVHRGDDTQGKRAVGAEIGTLRNSTVGGDRRETDSAKQCGVEILGEETQSNWKGRMGGDAVRRARRYPRRPQANYIPVSHGEGSIQEGGEEGKTFERNYTLLLETV